MLSQSIPQIINSVITMTATLITMLILNPALDGDIHSDRGGDAVGNKELFPGFPASTIFISSRIWVR